MMRRTWGPSRSAIFALSLALGAAGCRSTASGQSSRGARTATSAVPATIDGASPAGNMPGTEARLPLTFVADVDLPGGATRFDYQDVDVANGRLVIAHMNDGAVVIVGLRDGSVLKRLTGIPVARGVVVADDVGTTFVTSSPSTLVSIDNQSLTEKARAETGNGPDGVGWDPADQVVGVSDQGDGALSLIANAGKGKRVQVKLGRETGNVVFDASRRCFWITVVGPSHPDRLVAVDPRSNAVITTIDLPGCDGAHGLRLHPDGASAFIACEANNMLARVDLSPPHAVSSAATGAGPDVLGIDPGLGWLYVAAESGDLTVFDLGRAGVALIGHDHPGDGSHSVAVDPSTHRIFFPLVRGPKGTPVLRLMKPTGT